MMDPRNLSIHNFNYVLPEERIARYPLQERDSSKLLIYDKGQITEDIYRHLADHLPENSLILFNDTKVIEARIFFTKGTGGVIEIFCLEPDDEPTDLHKAMLQRNRVLWRCMIGGASKWKHGQILEKNLRTDGKEFTLHSTYVRKSNDYFVIEFSWNEDISFAEVLHVAGAMPLPPYIKRNAEKSDAERYQTVYAHHDGSVAAPTAGLHFTDHIFHQLRRRNIETEFLTLHVGAGTFKPVKADQMVDHEMHSELIHVSKATIQKILDHQGRNIIAVGTTSLRTIESLYWLAVKIKSGEKIEWSVGQWEPYVAHSAELSAPEAMQTLLEFMGEHDMDHLSIRSRILLAPPYQVRLVNALITNFHQPQSTLLLLVASLIGDDWRKIYDYALKNDFRFLSYGDGCLLWITREQEK